MLQIITTFYHWISDPAGILRAGNAMSAIDNLVIWIVLIWLVVKVWNMKK